MFILLSEVGICSLKQHLIYTLITGDGRGSEVHLFDRFTAELAGHALVGGGTFHLFHMFMLNPVL